MRTARLPVDGAVSLAVDIWPGGEGAGFLLAHGLASNSQLWWATAERLHELGHACASVDQRGHGRSDKPDDGYTVDRACADLAAVLSHLRREVPGFDDRIVVAGQSWGGNVVLELAWRDPDMLAGVVGVDGGTIELSRPFPVWQECARALAPPPLAGTPLEEIEAFLRRSHPHWPESGIRATLASLEVRADGTVAPWLSFERHMLLLRALWEHHPSTRYPEIKVPVLLVPADSGGSDDISTGKRESVDEAVRAIPRAAAHWFSPADHDIHAQFPDELAELLHAEATGGVLA
ncbi:MAG TPA: alpha/beta hydrolase [Acidimicrobiales bacterium]|nr:alpha/beta hydrolase [Acidimicrobiales bacterium]